MLPILIAFVFAALGIIMETVGIEQRILYAIMGFTVATVGILLMVKDRL